MPDLKLSLPLKRHVCIELSHLDPRIVRRARPLPGLSRTCAVMVNSPANPLQKTRIPRLGYIRPGFRTCRAAGIVCVCLCACACACVLLLGRPVSMSAASRAALAVKGLLPPSRACRACPARRRAAHGI